jgi:hypothetical protein
VADPVSTTAVASVASAAKLFQTTLLVLYFTTGATTVKVNTKTKPEFEKKKIWALQSTSQIPTENPNMCLSIGLKYIHEFDEVSTVTVRAYCICPGTGVAATQTETQTNDACLNQQRLDALNPRIQALPAGAPQATIIRLGPNSTLQTPSDDR